jgi:BirA family biotin operon repressor/biotin-[acetyl-CoA-carboxylase] ligase
MDRTKEILSFLRNSIGYVSGGAIAHKIGISRTAVWKHINNLERMGYDVTAIQGKGYRLTGIPDKLYPWEIEQSLNTRFIGKTIIYRDTIESTNTLAFSLALKGEQEGTCVIAEKQVGGRGRLGRRWFSPAGKNLYMSIILRPEVAPQYVYPVTFVSSLAAWDTIKIVTGRESTLKWPNDVLMRGRKVCGTLLELSTETDMVKFVIIGIGFNINMKENELDDEIRQRATSLAIEMKKEYERTSVCGVLLTNLEKYYNLFKERGGQDICRMWEERSGIKGKHMEIIQNDVRYEGIGEGIDTDGSLLLNMKGSIIRIISGDVSL